MPLIAGQILPPRYRIRRTLGQGGMGAVYLAENTELATRQYAIKENIASPSLDPHELAQRRQQFLTEAQVLAAIDHPNLTKVSDFFTLGGNEYLVMDYVEGQNLEMVLAEHKQTHGAPLPEKPVLIWADQVLDALEYLHGLRPRPVIHRDIKPSNLILTAQGKIKLVDFGLVKLLDPANPTTDSVVRGFGTPPYTPLEQYGTSTQHTDGRSDIYALGATLYDLLTGIAPPNASERVLDPAKMIRPKQRNPALSPATEAAILKAMEIHPDDRFQTAREMRAALAAVRSAPPPPPPRPGPAPRKSASPWLKALAALAVLVVLLGIVWVAGQLSRSAQPGPAGEPPAAAVAAATALPPSPTRPVQPVTHTPGPAARAGPAASATPRRTPTPRALRPSPAPAATSAPAGGVAPATLLPPATATATAPPATSTPVPTATPRQIAAPAATRPPAPTRPRAAPAPSVPVLMGPADGAAITGRTTFTWQWKGPALGENEGFEVRIWREGQPDHYGAAEPTNDNRIEIDPRSAYGVAQGGAGDYYWTVAVVQRDPYKRTGAEAAPRRVRVENSGGGLSPASGGGQPGLPTSVPPPP